MSDYQGWYVCVNYNIDCCSKHDKGEAYEIYNWMLTDEGRQENFLTKDDVVTIHQCNDYGELKKRLAQQKALNEMFKNGLAEK